MKKHELLRVLSVACLTLLGFGLTGCESNKQTKKTTVEVKTPKTERKVTVETTKEKPDKD